MGGSRAVWFQGSRSQPIPADPSRSQNLATAGKSVSQALSGTMQCLPGQQEVEDTIGHIQSMSSQISASRFPQSGRPYGELQSQLTQAADRLQDATSEVVQTAPVPTRLATSSRQFGQVLGDMMECSMDMAGQTRVEETRVEMVSTMKNVTMSSSTFLSSAKTVAVDPSAPQAKNNLANAARYVVLDLFLLLSFRRSCFVVKFLTPKQRVSFELPSQAK